MNAYIFAGLKNGNDLLEQTPAARYKWYDRKGREHFSIDDKALIIEDYIANDISVKDLATKYKCDQTTITRFISMYFQKPDHELTLASRV